ncbi:uncharacterized protein LOC119484924 [Sebastes umbrosus]|uniref:uncharacterized protein LOC119484924 n=1 Tax=Sebastes umbrosus TaxID=72105 RepID=UPI00189CF9FF|nr:uncharacterized protein LOC119484924 [Sebastes umbrosus]
MVNLDTCPQASDPDVGEEGQLVYSLTADSPYFDVEPSSGLVYVVSAVELAGQLAAVEVKATDPRGLHATAKVEVEVQGSASSGDMVVISLNQPANIVEKKVPELEKSLGAALGWTVNIIEVSSANGGSSQSRTLRDAMKTLVSFISEDGGEVVSSEEVTKKLQSQSAAVREELVKVFGESLHFDVEIKPQSPDSNQAVVITLGAMFALSMLGLIVAVALIIRFTRKQKHQEDSDKESFGIGRRAEGYTNWPQKTPETIEKEQTRSQEKGAEDEQQRTDRKTDDNGARFEVDRQTEDVDSDGNESHTSAL